MLIIDASSEVYNCSKCSLKGKCGNMFTDGFALAKWCRRLWTQLAIPVLVLDGW